MLLSYLIRFHKHLEFNFFHPEAEGWDQVLLNPQWLLVKAYFSRKPELEHGFQSSHVVKKMEKYF